MRWQNSLIKLGSRTKAGIFSASIVMATIAGIVLGAMMLLTTADVVGRYSFDSPIKGTWEIIGLLLVCASTWGMGYCQVKKAHITVTIILEKFPSRVKAIIKSAAYFIGFAGFSLICWRVFLMAKKYFYLPRGDATDTLGIPYSPFMLILAIGTGMLALILLIDLMYSLAGVVRK
jgi:TRAP-type C4-dicarboxylate transport system permease small subunit